MEKEGHFYVTESEIDGLLIEVSRRFMEPQQEPFVDPVLHEEVYGANEEKYRHPNVVHQGYP